MNDKNHITMDCTDIKALLSAILDGELAVDQRHRAERHLAQCADCRMVVSDAEHADSMVAKAIGPGDGHADRLPEGFEAAVLARTVFADRAGSAAHTWRSWLGWLAAAASIVMAVVLWPVDRSPAPDDRMNARTVAASYPPGPEIGSWTIEELPAGTRSTTRLVVNEVARYPADADAGSWDPPVSGHASGAFDTGADHLSRDGADTIESLSLVLAMLQNADDGSFVDVEHARQFTEYEQLLPRLAATRRQLSPSQRPVIFAAESMLYRIVRGPLSLDDVRELRQTIARLDLPDRISAITGGPAPSSSSL